MRTIQTRILAGIAGLGLFIGGMAVAQRPAENINPKRHPNLAAAQDLSRRAWQRILDAQKANEWDMEGHPQKAKNLLDEVNEQLRLAANWANRNAPRSDAGVLSRASILLRMPLLGMIHDVLGSPIRL